MDTSSDTRVGVVEPETMQVTDEGGVERSRVASIGALTVCELAFRYIYIYTY